MHIRWTFWFLLACDNNAADPRLWPCVLVLCFLFSENKVTRVSDSKWEGFDCTNTRMIASKWIHPNPPLLSTSPSKQFSEFQLRHQFITSWICFSLSSPLKSNIVSLNPTFLYQSHSMPASYFLGSETLKWRQVQIWKGSISSPTKYVTKVSYYSSYHREEHWGNPPLTPQSSFTGGNGPARCGSSIEFVHLCNLWVCMSMDLQRVARLNGILKTFHGYSTPLNGVFIESNS